MQAAEQVIGETLFIAAAIATLALLPVLWLAKKSHR
jgi:hypothetical protein